MKKSLSMVACCAAMSLSACSPSALLKSDEPRAITYSLRSTGGEASVFSGPTKIVEISKPILPSGFDRNRIVLFMDDGRKLDYYAAAEWPAPLDSVIEEFTKSTLTATLPSMIAISATESVPSDYRLQLRVVDFEPIYGDSYEVPPKLLTKIEFTLIALPAERIVSNFILNRENVASSSRRDVIITELQSQLQSIENEAFGKLAPHLKQKEIVIPKP